MGVSNPGPGPSQGAQSGPEGSLVATGPGISPFAQVVKVQMSTRGLETAKNLPETELFGLGYGWGKFAILKRLDAKKTGTHCTVPQPPANSITGAVCGEPEMFINLHEPPP